MNYQTLLLTKKDDVATVTLNRPDVHNAMNEEMITEITTCFQHLSTDSSVSVIILTGNGSSFCAGADLTWMKRMVSYTKQENKKDSQQLLTLYETVDNCQKPVIGRINGHAFGGGIGLLSVCDITVTIPDVKFAFSEVKLGIIPAVISTFVAQRMTPACMRRYFITGERFESTTAQHIGLIDIIVPVESFDATIQSSVDQLRSSAPNAVREIKQLLKNLQNLESKKYKEFTVEKIAELRISQEGQEGIQAFLEKRKPRWKR